MMQEKALLRVSNLNTYFNVLGQRLHAVRGMDLTVREGEILGIVGESGSGKASP